MRSRPCRLPVLRLDCVAISSGLAAQAGADAQLLDEYNGQVSVHTTNQAVDAVSSNANLEVHILRTIPPSSDAVALEDFKLVVSTGALADNSIGFTVCRYETDKKECEAGAGGGGGGGGGDAGTGDGTGTGTGDAGGGTGDAGGTPDGDAGDDGGQTRRLLKDKSPPPASGTKKGCADASPDCAFWKRKGHCKSTSVYAP